MFVCHQVQSIVKWSVAGKGKHIKKTRSSYSLALVFMGDCVRSCCCPCPVRVCLLLFQSVQRSPHTADCDLWQLAARPSSFRWRMGRPPTVEFEPVYRGRAASFTSLTSLTCRSRWPHYHLANYLSMMMPCAVLCAPICPALLWSGLCRLAVISFICGHCFHLFAFHFYFKSNNISTNKHVSVASELKWDNKGNVYTYIVYMFIYIQTMEKNS